MYIYIYIFVLCVYTLMFIYIYIYIYMGDIWLSSQGAQEFFFFRMYASKQCATILQCNILQYCILQRLPAFTKLRSFSRCWFEWWCFLVLSVSWWPFIFNQKCARCFSDVHLSFLCLFSVSLEMCPFWIIVVRHVRKNQLWDYSVINRLPFSQLSTLRYWKWNYWLICPDLNKVLLVRELDLTQDHF